MMPIVDSIAQVVAMMRDPTIVDPELPNPPYYEFGSVAAVNLLMTAKNNRKQLKYQKYPLIFLRMDIPEGNSNGTMVEYNLNIGIATMTKAEYTPRQRYEHSFRETLYPLYEQFLKQVRAAGLFSWPGVQERPPHTKYDRPYWGTQISTGNVKNTFSDFLDAIEIVDLRINQRIKVC